MMFLSELPVPHVLAGYTEGQQVSPTGMVISICSLHKSPSSTSSLKAEKSSLQVCKGNYSQMSISQGNLERLPSYHPTPKKGQHRNLCAHPQMPQQNKKNALAG